MSRLLRLVPGAWRPICDRTSPAYLDAARACYAKQGARGHEFGAEANRDGPVEEKGTWAFQADLNDFHLGVYATKPWLGGAMGTGPERVQGAAGLGTAATRARNPPLFQKGLTT